MYSVVNKVLYVALLAVILSACGNADREAALQQYMLDPLLTMI